MPKGSRIDLFKDFTRYNNENSIKAIEEYYKISRKFNLDFAKCPKFCEIQYKCNEWCYDYATVENKCRKCKCKIK